MHLRLASADLVASLKASQRLERRLNPSSVKTGGGGWEPGKREGGRGRSASPSSRKGGSAGEDRWTRKWDERCRMMNWWSCFEVRARHDELDDVFLCFFRLCWEKKHPWLFWSCFFFWADVLYLPALLFSTLPFIALSINIVRIACQSLSDSSLFSLPHFVLVILPLYCSYLEAPTWQESTKILKPAIISCYRCCRPNLSTNTVSYFGA
jgi:hypothetical protein